jgi:hypothetical protein
MLCGILPCLICNFRITAPFRCMWSGGRLFQTCIFIDVTSSSSASFLSSPSMSRPVSFTQEHSQLSFHLLRHPISMSQVVRCLVWACSCEVFMTFLVLVIFSLLLIIFSSHFMSMWPCFVTNFFIIKPTRCTNFTNLFWCETLHVSDSSSVHYQEFIHCTLSSGTCHTAFEQDQDGTARKLFTDLYDIYHCWVYSE